jgi:hypothetical protein
LSSQPVSQCKSGTGYPGYIGHGTYHNSLNSSLCFKNMFVSISAKNSLVKFLKITITTFGVILYSKYEKTAVK